MNAFEVAALLLKKSKREIPAEDLQQFKAETLSMPSTWSDTQKAWHLTNTLDIPKCKQCNNQARFLSTTYWSWCSNKCMGSDPQILLKKQQTNIKKHGTENPQSLPHIKQKQKKTVLEKYGVDNFAKSILFKEKSTKTFEQRYGVTNPAKHNTVKEKIRQKAKQRNHRTVMEKRKATNQIKIGKDHNHHRHLDVESIEKLNDIQYLIEQHVEQKKSCNQIASELGCSPTPILLRFAQAGIKPQRHNISAPEVEIVEYIKQLNADVEISSKKIIPPYEIDIFLPKQNCAIEVNGIYWHSELKGKDKNYHLNKTTMCEHKGIQLIHILDIEWLEKTHIVKSKIANMLQKNISVFARKCTVQEISSVESKMFLNQNHLQASCNSQVKLGLFYQDQLISVMTFGKSRFSKKYQWEMVRFCTKIGYHAVGGASKMFLYFVKHYDPQSVVSYADRRWSNGNLYEKINFEFSHNSAPNYYYFHNSNPSCVENRIKYQKHKLKKIFDHVDMSKTEWEIMKQNNYNRFWDCGNKVYTWKK
jgi:hypothetical protein